MADSFDAMSWSRTYRNGLPHDQAIAEIRRLAGTAFDPRLAETFVNLDFGTYFSLIENHLSKIARKTA